MLLPSLLGKHQCVLRGDLRPSLCEKHTCCRGRRDGTSVLFFLRRNVLACDFIWDMMSHGSSRILRFNYGRYGANLRSLLDFPALVAGSRWPICAYVPSSRWKAERDQERAGRGRLRGRQSSDSVVQYPHQHRCGLFNRLRFHVRQSWKPAYERVFDRFSPRLRRGIDVVGHAYINT